MNEKCLYAIVTLFYFETMMLSKGLKVRLSTHGDHQSEWEVAPPSVSRDIN